MLKKISNKLILTYICITVLLAVIIFTMLGSLLRSTLIGMIKSEMSTYDQMIDYEFEKLSIKPESSRELADAVSDLAKIIKLRITVIKKDGTVIADSDVAYVSRLENHQYRKEIIEALNAGAGFSTRYSNTLKTDMLYYAVYKNNITIRIAKPLHEVDQSLAKLRRMVFNVSLFAVVFSVLIIVIISIKITRPLKETLDFASEFAAGNYKRRVLNYSNDEIGTLQKGLNIMADTIVRTIDDHILEHRKLEATIDSINEGIAMIDSGKHIIIHNNSFLSMLGITSDIKNRPYYEVIRNSTLNSRIVHGMKTLERDIFEIEMSSGLIYEAVINPISENRVIRGMLVVLHDISEKRKIERIKSDLVSNVSHELKTPIAIIRGYLETIKENYGNREMSMNFIDRAIENVDRQNALIQDIIKLNMIESAKDFEMGSVNVKGVIESCLDLLAPKIAKRGINLISNLSDETDYNITANNFLVEEIFFNIIDNGINYNSDRGTLSISSAETDASILIRISDTGVGIPAEFMDRIFERFYRVDRSRSRSTGGTGLGLSIVKHAAMVLSWDVAVESGTEGSTFTVSVKKNSN